jgi:hypothetical protein
MILLPAHALATALLRYVRSTLNGTTSARSLLPGSQQTPPPRVKGAQRQAMIGRCDRRVPCGWVTPL